MIRRLEREDGCWVELKPTSRGYEFRYWDEKEFRTGMFSDMKKSIKSHILAGYTEVAMKLDPNDLVANACNCPGTPSGGTMYYKGKWHNSDCNIFKTPAVDMEQLELELDQMFGGSPTPKNAPRCECGADAVYGPGSGMHSATMPCPLYKKV
jgi:hypothetical protein